MTEPLTEKELEFVQLAGQGLTCEEIADRISRSRWAIYNYRSSVIEKTGSNTLIEAVVKLYDLGILKPKASYETIRNRSHLPTS